MVDQIRKPGVNITQVFEGTPPTPVTANLVPCIVGPAFEVVELLDDSGAGSAESRVQSSTGPLKYKQVPVTIPVSEYPTPRADANEMSVMTDEVRVALQRTGALDILDRSPGSAFLAEANIATRPGIWISSTYLSEQANAGRGVILLVDTAVTNNAASVFVQGVAGSTAADYLDNIVSSVNGVGYVAHELNGVAGFILHSNRFGASASISMVSTSGGSVSSFFNDIDAGAALQVAGEDLTKVRVEGSGLYAEDNVVAGILTSPFIAHSRGSFSLTTTATTHVLTDNTSLGDIKAVQVHINGEIVEVRTDAVDFANDFALQAATPTSNGDSITASGPFGQSIGSHQIIGVASDRVRVGIVDTERSVYDAEGNPVQQRYVDAQLNSMSSAVPFAPKNAFFRAHSLKSFAPDMSTSSTRAAHVAEAVGITPAEAATVGLKGWTEANSDAFSGLAFALFLTIDGVDEAFTLQFSPVDGDAQAASFSAQTGGKINVSWNDGADLFVFSSALKGAHVRLLLRDIVAGSGAVSALQVVGGGASSATGADLGAESEAFGANDMFIAAGAGDTFSFRLNGGSAVHTTILASNDVHEFVCRAY
jgi:hypothetical protein